jgi:type I restriction enzyme S subunit
MSKEKLIPELRFPEFKNDGDWDGDSLINIAKFRRGSFPQPYGLPEWYDDENGMPFIQVYDVDDNFRLKQTTKRKISELAAAQSVFIEKGTVIITIQGSIGRVAITQYDAYIDRTLLIFQEFYNNIDKTFFAYILFLLFEIEKLKAPGGIIKTITKEVLSDFVVSFPKVQEQQKIASCLSSLDELLAAHNDKLDALKDHKKGLLQNLFPQEGETVPKLRFPEFEGDGEWVEKKLNTLSKRVIAKNRNGKFTAVFTNSATDGIVDQRDYFDKDIANKKNLENYFVVQNGDYVYNPRISEHAPVGPLFKNRLGKTGVMSPLYTVFRFNEKNNDFYEYYFQTSHWRNSIRAIANTGARFDRISITASLFMEIPVLYTGLMEQQKIASCLSAVDELITAQQEKIEQLQQHKKGLMQGLFPKMTD